MAPVEVSPGAGVGGSSEGVRVGRDGPRTAVWLSGEHDLASARLLSMALAEAMADNDADMVVDLTELAFMDASTLGVLVRGRQLLTGRGRCLTLRSPQRFPRKVIDACGLTELIEGAAS